MTSPSVSGAAAKNLLAEYTTASKPYGIFLHLMLIQQETQQPRLLPQILCRIQYIAANRLPPQTPLSEIAVSQRGNQPKTVNQPGHLGLADPKTHMCSLIYQPPPGFRFKARISNRPGVPVVIVSASVPCVNGPATEQRPQQAESKQQYKSRPTKFIRLRLAFGPCRQRERSIPEFSRPLKIPRKSSSFPTPILTPVLNVYWHYYSTYCRCSKV